MRWALTRCLDSALISSDSIKPFDEENWAAFRKKCSAPKFKLALTEARRGTTSPKLAVSPRARTQTFVTTTTDTCS